MIKFFKQNWPLLLVLVLAVLLRFFRLGFNPPSLDWDEAALGYNAYSILKTGRDEYGNFLPLIFKSFGDFKPGLYVYLCLPFVAIFGLSEIAVRFPSAILGVGTVWLLYLVISKLYPQQAFLKAKIRYPFSLAASFVLAVMPWHLQFSRGGWETNAALFFLLLGFYLFLLSLKKPKWLLFSAFSFGLTLLTYQSSKMITPLFLFGLFIFFRKEIKKIPLKFILTSLAVFFIVCLPIIYSSFSAGNRLKVMSLLSYPRGNEEINQILKEDNNSQAYFEIYHNDYLSLGRGFLERYFNHFSGKFLFFEGDWSSARHGAPYVGVLYYIDIIFLLAGFWFLISQKKNSSGFLWYWLLISPLPAALSRDSIHAVRSLNMVLPLAIIIGAGIFQIHNLLKKKKIFIRLFLLAMILGFYSWCLIYYFDQYYTHYPLKSSQFWQYGYKQLVNKIAPNKNNYERIIFTTKYGQPYIYWLFYSQYDPKSYQAKAKLTENQWGDVGSVDKLDNIEFRELYWPSDRSLPKSLFIGTEEEIPLKDIDPNQSRILDEIFFLNGKVAFRVMETL